MSFWRCKGTAVLGSGQKFCGLLPEVVATGAGICDISATKQQNRVAKAVTLFLCFVFLGYNAGSIVADNEMEAVFHLIDMII